MRRTVSRLADGRELIYFDEDDGAVRSAVDERDLPVHGAASEIRYDVVRGEWVAVASHRQDRTHLPPLDGCPLCPSTAGRLTEIPSPDYAVVVFENRFPSFAGADDGAEAAIDGEELFVRRPGAGRCEVVCFTSDHDASFADLPPERVRTVIEVWVDRTLALAQLPGVEQVFVFENRGREIGVTLSHPHGQIYGYPFVTPRTRRMFESARRHREQTGRSLFADVLAAEQRSGIRVVARGEHWTAFVPAAARWPIELHLYPHRQVPDLPALTEPERDELATLYVDLLRRLDALFGVPMPYVAAWHQAPARADRELAWLHLELFSVRRAPERLKHLAGSEASMGVFVNDIAPEAAAEALRLTTTAVAATSD
jgi:UDPglucose--hexose-1-phosphate uridylyltransferase